MQQILVIGGAGHLGRLVVKDLSSAPSAGKPGSSTTLEGSEPEHARTGVISVRSFVARYDAR